MDPALGADGKLKPASELDFFESETDTVPISKGAGNVSKELRHGQRRAGQKARMVEVLAAENYASDGEIQAIQPKKRKRRGPVKKKSKTNHTGDDNDTEDTDFVNGSDSEISTDSSDLEVEHVPTNAEIANFLPSKTLPTTGRGSGKWKRKTTIEEVEDVDSPARVAQRSPTPLHGGIIESIYDKGPMLPADKSKKSKSGNKNPIYLFYEKVECDKDGEVGTDGDSHYRCYHGAQKVCSVWKSMKYNLTGLVNNLKASSPHMFHLYTILKAHPAGEIVTQEEMDVAAGRKIFDSVQTASYLKKLESASANPLSAAFERQAEAAAGPWDQDHFEQLLAEWLVSCDQPFEELDRPEFRELLTYAHHPASDLKIPHRDARKQWVMKMGEIAVQETKDMFANDVEGKISLSLDAWTSSNNYAFLAIVAHYIMKTGDLEELLIDFRELMGEHSGENMAEAVWETLTKYGISDRIFALMLDNASNNDMLVDGIASRARAKGIAFNPLWACLWCMPHTVHLVAIKLLEAIGAISAAEGKKTTSRSGNYQDSATAPLGREHDDDAEGQDGADEQEEPSLVEDTTGNIFSGVDKLRKIVCAICASPQRKQTWVTLLSNAIKSSEGEDIQAILMLILDVKTRWSSTHQMLWRALDYRNELDDFVSRNCDLRGLELSSDEWDAISQVASWLKAFRSTTTDMSTTKKPMLSTTLAIFRGLQQHIQQILHELPDTAPPQLKKGLLDAHLKLSEYYYRFDQSPFYTWAALLNPQISYEGVKEDYEDDEDLLTYLEDSRSRLDQFFKQNYVKAKCGTTLSATGSTSSVGPAVGSPKKVNFTARYQKKDRLQVDKLEEYFKLPHEDFDSCDPLKWWLGCHAQFPNLYRLVCDIFSIPGSAMAVERIFSGGQDTISLRRASLQPGTIRVLMLVKHHLRLACIALKNKDT